MRCCHFEVYISSYCVFIIAARVSSKDDVTDEEDLADTSLVLVEDQKSVIFSLLSQLKQGMDLTQVVLPTFILETRSLLEMFADCMGHPQLFVWSVYFFHRSLFLLRSIRKSFGEINSYNFECFLDLHTYNMYGPGSSVSIATELRAGWSWIESQWGRDFPPIQTGPGAHPASCKMGTRSFLGVKCGHFVLLTTHPPLVPWSWKNRAIPLPTLWATPDL